MPQGILYIKHIGSPHGVQHERQGCLLQLGPQLSMFQILCLPLSCHSCSICLCSLLLTHLLLTRNTCSHIYIWSSMPNCAYAVLLLCQSSGLNLLLGICAFKMSEISACTCTHATQRCAACPKHAMTVAAVASACSILSTCLYATLSWQSV